MKTINLVKRLYPESVDDCNMIDCVDCVAYGIQPRV